MKVFKVIFFILLATVFLGAAYILPMMGPKGASDTPDVDKRVSEAAAKDLVVKSIAVEDEYKKRVGINAPKEDDIRLLEGAISALEEYERLSESVERVQIVRLRDMRKIVETFRSNELHNKMLSFEQKAKEMEKALNYEAAADAYREAILAQSEINARYPNSQYSSEYKTGEMSRNIKLLEARPLYEQTMRAEESAKAAVLAKDWQRAKKEYSIAINAQHKIHQNFPDLRYANHARLRTLEREYDSLLSADLHDKISAMLEKARTAAKNGKNMEVADCYHDAIQAQKQLNKDFVNSKFYSEENIKNWEIEKERALSADEGALLSDKYNKIMSGLKNGNIADIIPLIEPLLYASEKFKAAYPNNTVIDERIILKLRYLNYIKNGLSEIQKTVNENLHPKLYNEKWNLMKCEVWQDLYSFVMQDNPSRNKTSGKNPAEFMVYEDAERFCTRLSWIMGREVSLPTEEIFRQAIGDTKYINLNEIAWHSQNSGGATREVMTRRCNDLGYYDLLGNVCEYLKSYDGVIIKVIGGGVQTSTDIMLSQRTEEVPQNQRSRDTGFRVMVEKK